ncbi:MAG TPA: polymer-forming cytoskeletal protein [Candidatus Deferrimicrobium sp.]|nr:polymer-forming cytoskeletal protein [Candidatus Deferrimicrobium sp.]
MKRLLLGLILLPLLILYLPSTAKGAWGESVYPKDQEISYDLIKANDKVIIEGTVKGDILAAGSTVRNAGHVTNDFLALATYIHHTGRVEGNARLVGKDIIVDGIIEKNLSSLGYKQTFGTDSMIKGNLISVGSVLSLNGKINGKVIIRGDSVTLGAEIDKDVEIYANSLTILPRAKFNGAVTYFGPKPATVNSASKFSSPLVFKEVYVEKPWQKVSYSILGLLLLALIAAGLAPKVLLTTAQKLVRTPGRSFGFGLLFFLLAPLSALLLALFRTGRVTALLLSVSVISLSVILFFFSQVLWGTVLGKLLWSVINSKFPLPVGPNLSAFLQTIIGTFLVGLACKIPYLGILLSFSLLVSCTGLGLSTLFSDVRWKTSLHFGQRVKGV